MCVCMHIGYKYVTCMCVCVCLCLFVCVCACVCIHMRHCVRVSICMHTHISFLNKGDLRCIMKTWQCSPIKNRGPTLPRREFDQRKTGTNAKVPAKDLSEILVGYCSSSCSVPRGAKALISGTPVVSKTGLWKLASGAS